MGLLHEAILMDLFFNAKVSRASKNVSAGGVVFREFHCSQTVFAGKDQQLTWDDAAVTRVQSRLLFKPSDRVDSSRLPR